MDINLKLAEHQVIEIERLILRKIRMDDAEDIYAYGSDDEVSRWTGWTTHQSIEETKSVIANIFIANGLFHWALEDKASRRMIGEIFLMRRNEKMAELGWVLNREFWGNGYMPEAARALLKLCFEELEFEVVQACRQSISQKIQSLGV